jgi:type II secretory pathway pseudopilin PulG
MPTWSIAVIVIAVAAVVALVAVMATRQRRTAALRGRFGAEYDRTVEARDDQRSAEADLRARERERARLDIKPLPEAVRAAFADEWFRVQERFVDHPVHAVGSADELLHRVMSERGYPTSDFDAEADLVSVDHPGVVENYRVANAIHQQAQMQQVSTEDLREALIRYRSLFDELLRADDGAETVATTRQEPRDAGVSAPDASGHADGRMAATPRPGPGDTDAGDVRGDGVQRQGAFPGNVTDLEAGDDAR